MKLWRWRHAFSLKLSISEMLISGMMENHCLNVFWCFVVLTCYRWGMNKWTICQYKQNHISSSLLVAVPSKCLKAVILAPSSQAEGGMTCLDPEIILVCVKKLQKNWSLWESERCDRFYGYPPTITGSERCQHWLCCHPRFYWHQLSGVPLLLSLLQDIIVVEIIAFSPRSQSDP